MNAPREKNTIYEEIQQGTTGLSIRTATIATIYINDLPDGLENVFKIYADDSKVIAEVGEDGQANLQKDILRIKDWCDKWYM